VSQYSKQHRVLGLCLRDVPAMLDIHDNLRLVDIYLQRLVSLHTEVVLVQLQSCILHKHGKRLRHRLCALVGGASLLYSTIQHSSLCIAVAVVVCVAVCRFDRF
jgi:hypothetical protein